MKIKGTTYKVWYNDALDPDDPHYKKKLAAQIVVRRLATRAAGGNIGVPSIKEIPDLLDDVAEYARRSRETVGGLKKQVIKKQDEIQRLKRELADAETPAKRDKIAKKLNEAQRSYRGTLSKYEKAKKQSQPFDWDAEVRRLSNRVDALEREARNPRLTQTGRKQAQQRLNDARQELEQAKASRKRYQGPDETGGAPTTKRGPRKPPTGPTTGAAKSLPKGSAATNPKPGNPKVGTPKPGTQKVEAITPKTRGSVPFGPRVRVPRVGRVDGLGLSPILAEQFGQGYAEHLDQEHQELYEQALRDPALRKRVIDDYEQNKGANPIQVLGRGLDTSKGFTQGASRDIGPKLVEAQKVIDHTKQLADKSNSDPLYQQARRECGGYDTCVTERVRKLREQNAKDVAVATKKAQKSANDPLYQQAQRDCGGYDTCVKDRLKKLRAQATPTTTKTKSSPAKPKTDPDLAKKQYEEAAKVCGGYDTCIKDRLNKVRNATSTTKPKTSTATKPKPKPSTKSTKTKSSPAKPKTDPDLAKKQYEEAAKVCGGYDTCIKDRLNKVRNTTSTTKPKTSTAAKPKASSKPKAASK
ncbi:hypothetical protein GA0074695_6289 [Micromonospora viridifaciens]|uniref:Uncharacterized protein n=2 Tax=Micromonospora viridifaciens TaxID=1881 RepID=A0A1C4ZXH4_MICVI|nr:hypothetical protein GA0074695_6289 [Micromonospora viridifaciens]